MLDVESRCCWIWNRVYKLKPARWCSATHLALKFLHCLLSFSALGVAYEGNPMWAQEVGHRLVKASLSSGMWYTLHIVYHISEKNIFKVLKKSNIFGPKEAQCTSELHLSQRMHKSFSLHVFLYRLYHLLWIHLVTSCILWLHMRDSSKHLVVEQEAGEVASILR